MSTTTARTTEPAAHAAITADFKALDLPGSQEFAEPLADAVARQHHTHARYVAEFLTCECEQHDDRRRALRVKEARFPRPKCLKDFVVGRCPICRPRCRTSLTAPGSITASPSCCWAIPAPAKPTDVRQLEGGCYRARASNRDDGGALHRLELAPPPPAQQR